MGCEHDGYHEVVSRYDRAEGLLAYDWRCETCGVLLGELGRFRYRPRFAPLSQAAYPAGGRRRLAERYGAHA